VQLFDINDAAIAACSNVAQSVGPVDAHAHCRLARMLLWRAALVRTVL
jgi:hypothetical protein